MEWVSHHIPCDIHLLECPIPPLSSSSSVLSVTKNTDLLSLPSDDDYHECWVNKYRSSSLAALPPSLQPANDEYENFGRIGDGEYVMVY